MKTKFNLLLIPIIFIIFSSNCGKNNDQKVYKKIDTIEASSDNKKNNIGKYSERSDDTNPLKKHSGLYIY